MERRKECIPVKRNKDPAGSTNCAQQGGDPPVDAVVGEYLQMDHRQGYRKAGRSLRRCLGQLEAYQGIRPGVGQVSVRKGIK